MSGGNRGFTLIELMITLVIVAIGLALAIPSWSVLVEKREVTATAEEIVSFLGYARSEAVKRNENINVSWYAKGHSENWCIGLSAGDTICDCTVTNTAAANFCDIDDVPQRLVQSDFVDMDYDFLHTHGDFNNDKVTLSFEPIRGILDIPAIQASGFATDLFDMLDGDDSNDYMFYLHSNDKHDKKRLYELQIWMNALGQASICADDDRRSIIGGYPIC